MLAYETEFLPLAADGLDPDLKFCGLPYCFLQVWDGNTGRRVSSCERLHPDHALAAEGWRHRFLREFPSEHTDKRVTTVVTQMLRDVKPVAGAGRSVESRALLHDVATGRVVRTLDARPGAVMAARFTPGGAHLLTSHQQNPEAPQAASLYTVWEVATGRALWSRELVAPFRGFTPDGRGALFGADGAAPGARLYVQVTTGGPLPPPADDPPGGGNGLRAAAVGSSVVVSDARTGLRLDAFMAPGAYSNFSWIDERGVPFTAATITGTQSRGTVTTRETLFTVSTCRAPRSEVIRCSAGSLVWSGWGEARTPSRHQLYSVAELQGGATPARPGESPDGVLRVVNLATGSERTLSPPPGVRLEYNDRAFFPHGEEHVATFAVRGTTLVRGAVRERDGTPKDLPVWGLLVLDLETGKDRFFYPKRGRALTSLGYGISPDGSRIVACQGRDVECLDAVTGRVLWTTPLPKDEHAHTPAFLPNGGVVIFDDWSGNLTRFSPDSGQIERVVRVAPRAEGHSVAIHDFEPTPDGGAVLVDPDGSLCVGDSAEWKVRHRFEMPKRDPNNPTSRVGVWQLKPRLLHDRFVLYKFDQAVEVWDAISGRREYRVELSRLQGSAPGDEALETCTYSPDESRMFLRTDRALRLIDVRRGRELLILDPTPDERDTAQRSRSWTEGNRTLLSLSPDGHELTVYTERSDRGGIVRRVYDARPRSEAEIALAGRIQTTQTPPPLPPPPTPGPPVTASDFLDVAERLRYKDGPGQIAAYRKVIELDPEFTPAHRALARLLKGTDAAASLAEFRETVRLDPRDYFSRWEIGLLLRAAGDNPGAIAAFCEAIRDDVRPQGLFGTRLQIGAAGGEPPRAGAMYTGLALALRDAGGEAEEAFRRAFRAEPSNAWYFASLARGEANEVEREANALLKHWEDRLASQPDNFDNARAAAESALEVGSVYLWEGRYGEAVAWCGRSVAWFTEYYKKVPSVPDPEKRLRWAHWNRAVAYNWLDRGRDAIEEMDLAMKYTPAAEQPYQRMMRVQYVAKSGDHRGAARLAAEEIAKTQPSPNYWDAALAYSLCVRAAKGDEKLQAAYGDLAVETLKKAFAAGFSNVELVKKDRDLDPIRGRADFKQALAKLEKDFPPVAAPPGRVTASRRTAGHRPVSAGGAETGRPHLSFFGFSSLISSSVVAQMKSSK